MSEICDTTRKMLERQIKDTDIAIQMLTPGLVDWGNPAMASRLERIAPLGDLRKRRAMDIAVRTESMANLAEQFCPQLSDIADDARRKALELVNKATEYYGDMGDLVDSSVLRRHSNTPRE